MTLASSMGPGELVEADDAGAAPAHVGEADLFHLASLAVLRGNVIELLGPV